MYGIHEKIFEKLSYIELKGKIMKKIVIYLLVWMMVFATITTATCETLQFPTAATDRMGWSLNEWLASDISRAALTVLITGDFVTSDAGKNMGVTSEQLQIVTSYVTDADGMISVFVKLSGKFEGKYLTIGYFGADYALVDTLEMSDAIVESCLNATSPRCYKNSSSALLQVIQILLDE